MAKNGKTTLKKLEGLINVVARNVAGIKENMATKDDIANMATKDDIANMATKDDIKVLEFKIEDTERKLSAKIDVVEEKVDNLEMVDVLDLQGRVSILEKDVKQIKHKHV